MGRVHAQRGFTLIELLVVVTIVGILASIAIPQFKEYRARAYDAVAQSDLRNVAVAQEAYFLDNESYSSSATELPGFVASKGVALALQEVGTQDWSASSYHAQGTSTFCFNSSLPEPMAKVVGIAAGCS